MGLGEFFTSCDSVLLLHLCGQIFPQTFMKNLTKCLNINVHLILHILWGHLIASGHKYTNFCNCFQIYSSWGHPLLRSPSRSSCPTLNCLNHLKRSAHNGTSFPYTVPWMSSCFCNCFPKFETNLDVCSLVQGNKEKYNTWGDYRQLTEVIPFSLILCSYNMN